MARPIKNSCDYFSHDSDMRNHRKVKALRISFKNGYAIWVMMLEYLTGADGNEFENVELEIELMAGDFGFPVSEVKEVIDYCLKMEMIFENKNGFISSESLNERLAHVYEKREKQRELSKKQLRKLGKFTSTNTEPNGVTDSRNTVKESKVNKTKPKKTKPKKSKEFTAPTLIEVTAYFKENGFSETAAIKAFEYYNVADWIDAQGTPVISWKQKMISVWFKDENKIASTERKMVR